MGDAIRSAVALQETAGLDVVTDGEWWRKIVHRRDRRAGPRLRAEPQPGRRPAVDGRRRQALAEEARLHRPGSRVPQDAHEAADQGDPARPGAARRADVGPEKSAKAYPKREDFVRDCVPILRREVELLRDEGVSIVQIDDPHLCLFVDPDVRRQYDDADKAADFAVDMDNQVVDGINGVKLAVHLCRRAGARAAARPTTAAATTRSSRSSTG